MKPATVQHDCHEELLAEFKALRNWLSDMAHWGSIEDQNVRQGFLNRLDLADKAISRASGSNNGETK